MTRTFILIAVFLLFVVPSAPAAELPFHGFLEYSVGGRVVNDDRATDDLLLNEVRFQLDFLHDTDAASMEFRVDFVHDWVVDDTYIDIREASILLIRSAIIIMCPVKVTRLSGQVLPASLHRQLLGRD